MTTFLKIFISIIFCSFWGQFQSGCNAGARSTGSPLGMLFVNITGLVLLFAGLVGIWKYKPQKSDLNENQKLDKS